MGRRIAFAINGATSGGSDRLHFGRRDVERVFKLLTDPRHGACDPDRSRFVHDCPSQGDFLKRFVQDVLKNWHPADQLIFYFSGHGVVKNEIFSLQMGPDETDAYPFNNFRNTLQQYAVHRFIIILDACHSGSATGDKGVIDYVIDHQLKAIPKGNAVIASCEHWQISKEHPAEQLSVFTHLFAQGIECGLPSEPHTEWLTVEHVQAHIEEMLKTEVYQQYNQRPCRKVAEAASELWVARNVHFRSGAQQQPLQAPDYDIELEVSWQLPMLRFPIEPAVLDELRQLLEETRLLVSRELSSRVGSAVVPENVRANMFLPDHASRQDGVAYDLFMHPKLRSNMNFPPEWDLRFAPGEGATGESFANATPVLTCRSKELDGGWDHRFKLTDEQRTQIHPDLKWIVSLPLIDDNTGEPLATLNVDGIKDDVPPETVEQIASTITGNVQAFSSLLAQLPRIQVLLGWSQ